MEVEFLVIFFPCFLFSFSDMQFSVLHWQLMVLASTGENIYTFNGPLAYGGVLVSDYCSLGRVSNRSEGTCFSIVTSALVHWIKWCTIYIISNSAKSIDTAEF
jgi:hypothetical protein